MFRKKASNPVTLRRPGEQSTCVVNLTGAVITSWKVKGKEQLFIGKRSFIEGQPVIEGGIKLIFPEHGAWELGYKDGFAHVSEWEVEKPPTVNRNYDVEAIFSLRDNYFSRSMWYYSFYIKYHVILKMNELVLKVKVYNEDKVKFKFYLGINAFVGVENEKGCGLVGFKRKPYYLKENRGKDIIRSYSAEKKYLNTSTRLKRVYVNIMESVQPMIKGLLRVLKFSSENLPDIFVWHPFKNDEQPVEDYPFDKTSVGSEDHKIVCLGPGRIYKKVAVLPGGVFEAEMILKSSPPVEKQPKEDDKTKSGVVNDDCIVIF